MRHLISLALPKRFTHFPSFARTVELLLPQLSRLTTSYCQFTDPLPNLRCLKVNQCDESQLQHLFSLVPNLRSLSIELIKSSNAFWPDTMRQLIHLKQFQIKNYNLMTIDRIESIVTMIPSLKHLELELGILVDLKNEYRWDTFVSNLEKFDFRCYLSPLHFLIWNQTEILAPYKTPLWLEHKQWFVACDSSQQTPLLYTVPHFAPKNMNWPFIGPSIACTSSSVSLQQHSSCLKWSLRENQSSSFAVDTPYLSRAFPRLEKLNISVNSSEDVFYLLDTLKYLSVATFRCRFDSPIFSDTIQNETLSRYWLICGSQQLWMNRSFTSRINKKSIHVWLYAGEFELNIKHRQLFTLMWFLRCIFPHIVKLLCFLFRLLANN
ncbi:unnamed protein product [Adineta steineri]|uniref:Uncharacterized protein n=1 Tax=Adineta steineri TaxID=433720 RepID=A0A815JG38_9BILA|nr:unnamed protein product [Adineta steineri]CAF3858735.1 unnamed protein product [Adineta steineri]